MSCLISRVSRSSGVVASTTALLPRVGGPRQAPGEEAAERAAFIRNWSRDLVLLTDGPANLNEEGRRTLRVLDIQVREERISYLEGGPSGVAEGLRRIHFEDGFSLEREGLFHVPPQHQGSGLAKRLGCEIAAMGQAPAGVKGDPRTREKSVAGVYVDIFRTKGGATLQLRGAEQD